MGCHGMQLHAYPQIEERAFDSGMRNGTSSTHLPRENADTGLDQLGGQVLIWTW